MDGITILNTYEYCIGTGLIVAGAIVAVACGIGAFILALEHEWAAAVYIVVGCIMGVVGVYIGINDTVTRHEVVLDDSVSYIDLISKYEIIEQRMEIVVLEEKNN